MKKLTLTMAALGLVACSSTPKEEPKKASAPTMSMEAKQVAAEQQAPHVAEIVFRKGSSDLTPQAQQQLKKLLNSAKEIGKIEMVKVVSWADSEYPSDQDKELSKTDMKLADQRNRAIEQYISKQPGDIKVKAFSMAQRPSKFSDWTGSDEAKIKESLEDSGIPTTAAPRQDTPKASRAIIMVDME